jgi:hypothetical protein
MKGVFFKFFENLLLNYNSFRESLPKEINAFISFLFLVLLVVIYSIFVWHLYKFISKKNPLGLNLNKYNTFEQSSVSRFFMGFFYFLEYILILPFLIFFIFGIFTFLLIILSQSEDLSSILIVSATVITVIRITSYYKEALSQEIAKIFPFLLLTVLALDPTSLVQTQYFQKIVNFLTNLPLFFNDIKYYFIFILLIEVVLRFIESFLDLFKSYENDKDEEE